MLETHVSPKFGPNCPGSTKHGPKWTKLSREWPSPGDAGELSAGHCTRCCAQTLPVQSSFRSEFVNTVPKLVVFGSKLANHHNPIWVEIYPPKSARRSSTSAQIWRNASRILNMVNIGQTW